MNKIGKFNLIEENECDLNCDCGWNITIGGEDKKDLVKLKKLLKDNFK